MDRAEVSTLIRIRDLLLECGESEVHLRVLDFSRSSKERRKDVVRLVNKNLPGASGPVQRRLGRLLMNILRTPFPHDMP
jgi:hypothetical protein